MDFHLLRYCLSAPRPHGKRPAGKCGSPSESVAKIGRKCKVPMPSHIFLGSCTTKNSSRKHRTMVWPPFGPEKRLCPVGNTGVPRRSSERTVENLWGYAYRSSHKSGSCSFKSRSCSHKSGSCSYKSGSCSYKSRSCSYKSGSCFA